MKETWSAGGIVLNRDGEVLLVNQHGTAWVFPKGRIEEGETPLDAAVREIREESGIMHLDLIEPLGGYVRTGLGKDGKERSDRRRHITLYLFRTEDTEFVLKDPHTPEARWVPRDGVEGLLTHEKDREFFRKVKGTL